MKITLLLGRIRIVAALLGVVVLIGAIGGTAGAALTGDSADAPSTEAAGAAFAPGLGGARGERVPAGGPGFGMMSQGMPDPGMWREGHGRGPGCTRPELSDEQKAVLAETREIAEELRLLLGEAAAAADAQDWDGAQAALLHYVDEMTELDSTIAGFAATLEEGARLPLGNAVRPLAAHMRALAGVWMSLPGEYQTTVIEAVTAAAEASEQPRFWAGLLALSRGNARRGFDPEQARGRLERMLEKAERNLQRSRTGLEGLGERIASLEQRLAGCTDETQRQRLLDLKHLAELEMDVCRARIARDEYAIQMLEERLAELDEQAQSAESDE